MIKRGKKKVEDFAFTTEKSLHDKNISRGTQPSLLHSETTNQARCRTRAKGRRRHTSPIMIRGRILIKTKGISLSVVQDIYEIK